MKNKQTNDAPLSMREIQTILAAQIRGLKFTGKATEPGIVSQANSVSASVGTVLRAVKLTLEYAKMTGQKPDLEHLMMSEPKAAIITEKLES